MYKLIETYRSGTKLSPPLVIITAATMTEMRQEIEYRVPRSQREDYVVVGHGRQISAEQCGAE